jgi:hypothetical protein
MNHSVRIRSLTGREISSAIFAAGENHDLDTRVATQVPRRQTDCADRRLQMPRRQVYNVPVREIRNRVTQVLDIGMHHQPLTLELMECFSDKCSKVGPDRFENIH